MNLYQERLVNFIILGAKKRLAQCLFLLSNMYVCAREKIYSESPELKILIKAFFFNLLHSDTDKNYDKFEIYKN
ncbi:MAG: hypothetical protein ACTSQJ_16550 [Promethearchaeota archaeon]